MINEIPFATISLFSYDNPLPAQRIFTKLSSVKKIDNWVVDKTNRDEQINIKCDISEIEKTSSGIHGKIIYNEQLKVRNSKKYNVYPTPYMFTISPSSNIVIIYGSSSSSKNVRTILEEFLHPKEWSGPLFLVPLFA